MASRLALKYGLVSEEDRLSNSADALIVTEPTTGSKARTKGSLYLIVTSRNPGGRASEACRLVADSIRREYYYDESAGIAIVLEKAIRSANRRLRHSREGGGLSAGAIGVAAAVVRGNELYVATCGEADSYLIRSARLLMPEHESGVGLPAPDALRVDVWRGEFAVGDSLVLCSRNVVEVVGTEELKNAVVTLHPQSAVEHLHHLFVAAGGEGSDAVLAIEATEVSLARVEHKLVPVAPAEPLAGAPARSPIPLADQFAGAASAVQDRAVAARGAARDAVSGGINRLLDLMPRRRASYRRIAPATSKRETQRRAALAVLMFIGVVAVLGVALWYWGPLRTETPIERVTEGEAALAEATDKVNEVYGSAELLETDPVAARRLLQDAWQDLGRAATAEVDPAAIDGMRERVRAGLEELYATHVVASSLVFAAPEGVELTGLVQGPDDAPYVIAGQSVLRIDPETGTGVPIVEAGEGQGQGIAAPRLLARGGPELLIVDVRGGLWRWRPSDLSGRGTLGQVRVAGDQAWGDAVVDVETFIINPDQGLYRLYVPYPSAGQILRYDPTADGSGFSAPAPYFISEGEDVASFRQLHIDGDVYAITSANLLRYFNGRQTSYSLDDPPDDSDLRPGHDYVLIAATGTRGSGEMFVLDARHARLLVYDKVEGSYIEQYLAAPGSPPLTDVRGMYVVDRGAAQPRTLIYVRADGLYQMPLTEGTGEPVPTARSSASPGRASAPPASPGATSSPVASPSEPADEPTEDPTEEPSEAPTERPRRTPRITDPPEG